MRLSYQQVLILKKLYKKPCYSFEFKSLYRYANLYSSLKNLQNKGLIKKKNGYYTITEKGKKILLMYF